MNPKPLKKYFFFKEFFKYYLNSFIQKLILHIFENPGGDRTQVLTLFFHPFPSHRRCRRHRRRFASPYFRAKSETVQSKRSGGWRVIYRLAAISALSRRPRRRRASPPSAVSSATFAPTTSRSSPEVHPPHPCRRGSKSRRA